MQTSYAITEKQKATLGRFTCCRLASDVENRKLVKDFVSAKGAELVDSLKYRGWASDTKGTIAYYLVKDPDGQAVFFFSLRCGLLCEPGYVKRISTLLEETELLQKARNGAQRGDPFCLEVLRRERERLGAAAYEELMEELEDLHHQKSEILHGVKLDKKLLPDQDVVRVDETHAAVELVEMCVNDAARESWGKWGMGEKRLGTTMFWQFVVPKMLELSAVAGCEYAYLFAAGEEDGALVRYYRRELHFIKPGSLGAVKPTYDMKCVLMCKKLFTGKPGIPGTLGVMEYDRDYSGLDRHREMFFDSFNAPAVP